MPSFFDLLKYAQTGIASPDMTHYDKMRARAMAGGYPMRTIEGVPPLTFRSDGKPLTAWSIYGNGQQQGTPTPDNPVMPDFVGVRTGNMFDDAVYSAYKQTDGTYQGTVNNFYTTHVAPFTQDDVGKTYTFTIVVRNTTSTNVRAAANINGTVINGNNLSAAGTTTVTFTVSSVNDYLYLGYGGGGGNQITISDIMLNSGSTALPYEPFGYKIPISCGGETTSVYLGQVSTVRKIRKLVLTGTEAFEKDSTRSVFYLNNFGDDAVRTADVVTSASTHYLAIGNVSGVANMLNNCITFRTASKRLYIRDDAITTDADAFKSYLAEQYAAGNPVTVWYVLSTPETATVNEPLCKIGDYADELHSEDAGVTIPTSKGSNTLTVDTDLQPSKVSITGTIKE